MRLMISDTPCSAIREKATGISSRTGQRTSPPGSEEYSLMRNELASDGQLYQAMMIIAGSNAKTPPRMSIHASKRGGSLPAMASMRTWSLRLSAYAATSRKTAELRYHWISSQAFEPMLSAYRATAVAAQISTAARPSHATERPMNSFRRSMALAKRSSAFNFFLGLP